MIFKVKKRERNKSQMWCVHACVHACMRVCVEYYAVIEKNMSFAGKLMELRTVMLIKIN